MGLDWHATIPATRQYQEDYIQRYYKSELSAGESMDDLIEKYAPTNMHPCSIVGAKKLKDLPNFEQIIQDDLAIRLKNNPNGGFTKENLMERDGEKWDCETCPFLAELKGADSTENLFLGLTVSSCDFRGKRISNNSFISKNLREEAYQEHNVAEMLAYALRLEKDLVRLRNSKRLNRLSYQDYLADFDPGNWAGERDIRLSETEYNNTPHYTEESLLQAVHWLRTCAKHGVTMATSY